MIGNKNNSNKPPFVSFVVFGKYDFTAEECDEITFKRGDPILVLEKDDEHNDGWWKGKTADKLIGLFPVDFTTFINIKQIDIDGIFEEIDSRKRRGSTNSNASSTKFSTDESLKFNSGSSVNTYSDVSQSPVMGSQNSTFAADENIELYSSPKIKSSKPAEYKANPPNLWSVDNVLEWLEEIGFAACVPIFKEKAINGSVLLEQNLATLREIGINHLKDRLKLFNSIVTLKEQYSEALEKIKVKNEKETKSKWRTSKYFEEKFSLEEEKKKINEEKKAAKKMKEKKIVANEPVNNTSRNISSPINIRPQLNSIVSRESIQLTNTNFNYYRSVRKENSRPSSQMSKSSISSITSFFKKLSFSRSSKKANQVFEPVFQQADYQGWLWTRFNKNSKWKKRWIILSKEKVYFLKEPKHPVNIKHTIQLSISFSIQPDIHKGKTKYTFNLIDSANSEITYFSADNHLLMMTWINVLVRSTTSAASRLPPCPEGKTPIISPGRNPLSNSPGQMSNSPIQNFSHAYERSPIPHNHVQPAYNSSPNQYHYTPIQQQMRSPNIQPVYQHQPPPQHQQHQQHQQIRTPIQQAMKPNESRNSIVILNQQQPLQQQQQQPPVSPHMIRLSPNPQPVNPNLARNPPPINPGMNMNINSSRRPSNSSNNSSGQIQIRNSIILTPQQQHQIPMHSVMVPPPHRQMDINSPKQFYPSPSVTPSQPLSKVVETRESVVVENN